MTEQGSIKIKLQAFDHWLLDAAVVDIINAVLKTGAVVSGPIPLPKKVERFTVLRSPHIDKKSREQFQRIWYRRLIGINQHTPRTIEALSRLELAPGIAVKIGV